VCVVGWSGYVDVSEECSAAILIRHGQMRDGDRFLWGLLLLALALPFLLVAEKAITAAAACRVAC
jgi:hypothetical protein